VVNEPPTEPNPFARALGGEGLVDYKKPEGQKSRDTVSLKYKKNAGGLCVGPDVESYLALLDRMLLTDAKFFLCKIISIKAVVPKSNRVSDTVKSFKKCQRHLLYVHMISVQCNLKMF
jgi:hypothetical protein